MKLSKRTLLMGAGALSIFAVLPLRVHASVAAARGFVTDLGNEAVSILQSSDPPNQKAQRLEDLFRRGFDFEAIGRFVLGRFWTNATPQQRSNFLSAFTDFVTQSYAQRLSGETVSGFTITNIRDLGEGDYLVQTAIARPNSPQLNYDWRVRQSSNGMKIVDIIIEGVSLLVTQRADFTSVASREGIDGLTRTLRQKSGR